MPEKNRGIRRLLIAGLCGWFVNSAGCAIPIRVADLNKEIPKAAMPVAIRAGIDTMNDPETLRRVSHLLADPQVRAAEQALVNGLLDSTLATLSDNERAERIGALTTKALHGMLQGATRELDTELASATKSAVDGALDSALSPVHRQELENLLRALIATSFRAAVAALQDAEVGKKLARVLSEELSPALGKALREEVAPGVATLLKDPELNQALGATAHLVGREMVLGATEALAKTQQPKDTDSLLFRLTEMAHQGARLFGSAAWFLILVIIALFAWTMKLLAQSRGYREEAERRAATSRFLAEATHVARGKPWADELIAALQERIAAEEKALAELRMANKHGWR
jgi:hypothetical protein